MLGAEATREGRLRTSAEPSRDQGGAWGCRATWATLGQSRISQPKAQNTNPHPLVLLVSFRGSKVKAKPQRVTEGPWTVT